MTPKTKFNQEAIVDAALAIAKEKGFSGITARSVANKLNASVAPIYVNFSTVDELVEAVIKRVFTITDSLLEQQQGDNLFERIGKASLAFAREFPVLFRDLSIQPNPYMASYETVESKLIEAMAQDETMEGWTISERKRLLLKMRVFQMGLSVMIANGHVPSWLDEHEFDALLMETGEDVLLAHQIKRKEDAK